MDIKRMFVLAPALILGGLLVACGGRGEPAAVVPPGAEDGDLQLATCPLEIDGVEYAADCGTLVVAENRSDPASRLIALPVTRLHATGSEAAEPIFYLGGGPGLSNMNAKPLERLLERHDFVMVGYRGVDGSARLACSEVRRALKGTGDDLLSGASLAGLSAAMRECAERLQAEGIDLDGYTALEVVDDMEAAREALGYERLNLVSFSYGTRVAQLYAHRFADAIHRSAMVSVNPHGRFVWEPDMIDAQIAYYAQLYAQSEEPRSADLAQTMRVVNDNMPRRWLLFNIDPGKVKAVTFALLFHRNTAAQAFDAWLAAEEGDPSGLAMMSLAYDFIVPSMSIYGEFFSKGLSADYEAGRDYATEMDPPGSIIGSPLSKLIWGAVVDDQGVAWPTALMPAEYRQVQPTEVQTLLVGGNVDFSTPVEYATRDLLPSLANGQQVVLAEMGHVGDVMGLQPQAAEHLLNSFFETGEGDDSQFVYAPMDFQVGLGFPQIAKLLMAAVVMLVLAVAGAVWWLLRRRKRAV